MKEVRLQSGCLRVHLGLIVVYEQENITEKPRFAPVNVKQIPIRAPISLSLVAIEPTIGTNIPMSEDSN